MSEMPQAAVNDGVTGVGGVLMRAARSKERIDEDEITLDDVERIAI